MQVVNTINVVCLLVLSREEFPDINYSMISKCILLRVIIGVNLHISLEELWHTQVYSWDLICICAFFSLRGRGLTKKDLGLLKSPLHA